MDKAEQHNACDEVHECGVACQQKPCGFAAALGRRQRVAHNSTGPTSVSIDLESERELGLGRRINRGNGSTLGEAALDVSGHSPVRQYASHPVCRAAKAFRWGIWHPSVMQFYSGPPIHFLSGVDRTAVRTRLAAGGKWIRTIGPPPEIVVDPSGWRRDQ